MNIDLNIDLNKFLKKSFEFFMLFLLGLYPFIFYPKLTFSPVTSNYELVSYFIDFVIYYKMMAIFICSFIMLVILILKVLYDRKMIKISLPFLLFIIIGITSTVFAYDYQIAITGFSGRWMGIASYLAYFIMFTYFYNCFFLDSFKKLLKIYLIASCIISIISLINYYGYDPFSSIIESFNLITIKYTLGGTIGNRNTVGLYLGLPFLLSLLFYLKNNFKSKNNSLFFLATTIVTYIGILCSLTRVAWISTFTAFIIGLLFLKIDIRKTYRKFAVILTSFILITIILNFTGENEIWMRFINLNSQIETAQTEKSLNNFGSYRFIAYKKSIELIKQKPLLGVGPDNFAFFSTHYFNDNNSNIKDINNSIQFIEVHNDYLEYATTMGIFALICFLIFNGKVFIAYIKRKHEFDTLTNVIFIAFCSHLLHINFNFATHSTFPSYIMIIAYLYHLKDRAKINE